MPSTDPHLKGRPRRRAIAEVERTHPYVCHLCGQPIDPSLDRQRDPLAWSCDELIPRHHGGSAYDTSLMRPAHRVCNSTRGTRPITAALRAACLTAYQRHATRPRRGTRRW